MRVLPDLDVEPVEDLGGSSRSTVRRVRDGGRTLIVKQFRRLGSHGWIREAAALTVAPAAAPVPRLVAATADPPIVVMSDAGPGPNVAHALLGTDPVAATESVVAWAKALATLHRTTADLADAFRSALDARASEASESARATDAAAQQSARARGAGAAASFESVVDTGAAEPWPVLSSCIPSDLDDAGCIVATQCEELGVEVPAGAFDELRDLSNLGGPEALTPADACPDNNVHTGTGLVLIDFEGAQWRPVVWDLAYLAVPWPSCWCAWQIPEEVSAAALSAYQGEFPVDLGDPLAKATAGWAFMSASWFLPLARGTDPPLTDPTKPCPSRRSMVLHRFAQTRRVTQLPALAELADRLHTRLTSEWGRVPLAHAPASAPSSGGRHTSTTSTCPSCAVTPCCTPTTAPTTYSSTARQPG